MGVWDDTYKDAIVDAQQAPAARTPAGFTEAYYASWEATRQEDLSNSEYLNLGEKRTQRRELIQKLTGEDISGLEGQAIPQMKMRAEARAPSQNAIVNAYNQKLFDLSARHPEIKTDDQLIKEIIEDSKHIRERSENVMANTNWAGKVGSFTGALSATMTDPLVLGSIPFGASAGAGILRTALMEAGVNMASEALVQPLVYRYKEALGAEYSMTEAMKRIALAGAGGGIVGGLARGAGIGLERLAKPRVDGVDDLLETFHRNIPEPTAAQRDAEFVLGDYADTIRETPFEARPELDELHLKATAKAVDDLENNRFVDVEEIVGNTPPRPELVRPQQPVRPLYEMTEEELSAAYKAAKVDEENAAIEVFGAEQAKRYERLQRTANSPNASIEAADKASAEIAEMEGKLTKAQEQRLFGIGQEGAASDELKDFLDAVRRVGGDTPQELGESLRFAMTKVGEETDPAKMKYSERLAFAQIQRAFDIAKEKGFDMKAVSDAALKAAAGRFADPADAAFMLQRYMKKAQAAPTAPPTRPRINEPQRQARIDANQDKEFKAWADMVEDEPEAMMDEVAFKAQEILDKEDVMIGQPGKQPQSAKAVLRELDHDLKQARMIQNCLKGGIGGAE